MTNKFKPQKIDVFFKTENSARAKEDFQTWDRDVVLEEEVTIDELIEQVGYRGSNRCGCFEIQTLEGIIVHKRGSRIDNRTPRKRANILFRTWEQLEADELAGEGFCCWKEERDNINLLFPITF